MSAFSANQRRILSLWLPRLPTDRIKRQREVSSSKVSSSEANAAPAEPSDAPMIVVAKESNALQIFALDDAAARIGLEIGLPLANARAICPQVQVFDADEVADAKLLNDIADWCDRFTPLVAPRSAAWPVSRHYRRVPICSAAKRRCCSCCAMY